MPRDTNQDSASTTGSGPPETRRGSKGRGRYPTWESLRWLFLFRLLMVVALVLVFSPAVEDPLVARVDGPLAWRVLVVYAILVMASGLNLWARWPSRNSQVYLAIFVDLIVFTLVMHAGGGVGSGLGVLLAIGVAASALMMEGRLALLFASFATLAVMTEQTYVVLTRDAPSSDFTQAGLL
ncbi:MAG TPA: two-component sensor histidine kinase, partial [Lamprocystis sp. (in: g-proteobacteria)]|nr:two-component sensor histidine kinase [Lamprocystis sp. (in: g-proteobacteria)]